MAVFKIPTTLSNPNYEQVTTLDGRQYRLHFLWNERDSHWYLNLYDLDGSIIAPSRKIVCNWPLLFSVTHENKPPGQIFAIDASGLDVDPGLDDLGTRVELQYIEGSELE